MRKKVNKNNKSNIVFIFLALAVLIVIVIVSLTIKPKSKDDIYDFRSDEFEHITSIGVGEFEASFQIDELSIIFFCSNESRECHEELTTLNDLAGENKLSVEYINVLELVDSEKEYLKSKWAVFKNDYYPNLVIIKDKKIVNNSNTYFNREELTAFLKQNQII